MVSLSNFTSSDLSVVKVFLKSFYEYHELKLFWVCFHGIDFKLAQMFTGIMFQIP